MVAYDEWKQVTESAGYCSCAECYEEYVKLNSKRGPFFTDDNPYL